MAELQRSFIIQTLPHGSSGIWGMTASRPMGLGAGIGDKARTRLATQGLGAPWVKVTLSVLIRDKPGVLRHLSCPQTEMGNRKKGGLYVIAPCGE